MATGAAVGTGAVSAYGWEQLSGDTPSDIEFVEKWVPSVCLQCPGGCGIIVRVINGKAVKIEGNPLYPSNRGKTCPKGQAGLQILYDPDRIQGPMRRIGERGSGRWQPIAWQEAIQLVASKIRELRNRGEPHTIIFMSGRNRGQMGDFIGRFCDAIGTPNNVGHSSICSDGSALAHWAMQGFKAYAGYDWDNCHYLLCFGGSFIEAWRPTARLLRAYGHMRRGREGLRAKIVQVDTRLSVTAAKADEWIPINPGTDAALALGIAHVMIKEGLYDQRFIAERTFGFDDFTDTHGERHIGFKTLVLRDYAPQKVSSITGVPVENIVRIAREFAATRPAIAAGERGVSMQSNGIYSRMAIHALNALAGSIDTPGGVLVQINPPFADWPDMEPDLKDPGKKHLKVDEIAGKGLKMPRVDRAGTVTYPLAGKVYQDIPDRILNGDPYPINMLFTYYTNPMFSTPDVGRWQKAIERLPFLVSFSPFMDETASHADLILPDHTYLERWHDDVIYPSMGYPVWGLRQPVVKPLYNTRNTGDVLIQIAQTIGGRVAELFPWKSFQEALKFRARGIFETKSGSIVAGTFEEWWQEFTRRGVWTNPPYPFGQWERVLDTPSKKFEFYSQNIQHKLGHIAEKEAEQHHTTPQAEMEKMLSGLGLRARGDEVFLPHFEPPRFVGDEKEYPFYLNTFKTMTHAEGRGANVPHLQEVFEVQCHERWSARVQINPQAAKQLGIEEGDEVWLESPVGRIKVQARLHPGALPNVVNMPFELGHQAYGRWAEDRGANPNWIIAKEYDRLGGLAAWFSTRVKIYKA